MANTSAVYARIDTKLKESAEEILSQLGITPSSAIQMLYSQIILLRGMPFEARLPAKIPMPAAGLTPEQFDAEMQKALDSAKSGIVYTPDEVEELMARKYGI